MRHATRLLALPALLLSSLPGQERIELRTGWEFAPETVADRLPESGWRGVELPRTFEDELGAQFDGVGWYRLRLDRPAAPAAARFRLLFHGAATAARVRADGQDVGGHLGAWTPWTVDVTDALGDGIAEILVRVDEKVGHNTQGFLPIIQPHFGGLWRSVALCIDRGPVVDREHVFTFGDGTGATPSVEFEAPVVARDAGELQIRVTLRDGAKALGSATSAVRTDERGALVARGSLAAPRDVRRWDPDRPNLYPVDIELLDRSTGAVLDRVTRSVGFRDLRADGTRVLWNGRPLQLRGMLHWGYSPPHFAPPEDPEYWRQQLEDVKSLGCNMLKVCLWIPPECVYEIADEIGLVVWQEYPTWHPTLTEAFLPELRVEYDEFHRYDRSHPSVGLRSLTCETGHSAELAVIQALYDRCKALVPQTLVVDDSAWIEWHRVHDFYDDHPYGNNTWWPGKLEQMKAHIAARTPKPLILGECIAADTWMDLAKWDGRIRDFDVKIDPRSSMPDPILEPEWWAPWGLPAQRAFERLVEGRFGRATREALRPWSLDYALRNRKYQIERLRVSAPDAGYTLSVIRDFTKARMGLFDDFGALKWSAADWAWHRDTMIALDPAPDRDLRGLLPGRRTLGFRVAHSGRGALDGTLTVRSAELELDRTIPVQVAEGAVSERLDVDLTLPEVERPIRFRIEVTLDGSHPATNHWDLWVVPRPTGTLAPAVRIVDHLDRATLDAIRAGARVVLRAGDRKGSLKTAGIWYLKGAPFAPPHPLHADVPADFLLELQSFDLEVGRVMRGTPWLEHVDPLLAFWDTHDIADVNPWLFAFTTRIGDGVLGATILESETPAGRYVFEKLVDFVGSGPTPRASLPDALVDRLGQALGADILDLASWNIALDPTDRGVTGGWQDGVEHEGAAWRPIRVGRHWEAEGIEHYDGVAWYRTTFVAPERWQGETVTLVCDGVDDSYRLYLNGEELARFGDPATGETVWLIRTTTDLTSHVRFGAPNSLVLRVVDHVGAGGIHKPVWLTTGPVGDDSDLVH